MVERFRIDPMDYRGEGYPLNSEFSIAVHALVFLNHKATTLSSEELAKNVCTNPARIRKVMAKLKKAGLIDTKEGIDGGYHFVLDPCKVTLRQISEALELRFVSASWKSGDADMKCLIASGMADIMNDLYTQLDRLCKEHLDDVTIQNIDEKIFHET